ncbi:MAG: methylmalonyl-CoA mutase family protein [Stappiaceae bacterium]
MSPENSPFNVSADGQNWLASAKKILRGADIETLRTNTLDGIKLEPIYQGIQNHSASLGRTSDSPWTVVQRIDTGSAESANGTLLGCLENGCQGVDLVLPSAPTAPGSGLSIRDRDDLEVLFSGVDLSAIEVRISGFSDASAVHAGLIDLARCQNATLHDLTLVQATDITLSGNRVAGLELASFQAACIADQFRYLESVGVKSRIATLDTRVWHNAGATNVLELALLAAQLVQLLRLGEEAGLSPDDLVRRIDVTLVADADQFSTIAKFRAARLLTSQLLSHCNIDSVPIPQHGETSWRMMSARDPWVNLLRTTMASFAAGVGGVDSLTVLPFTTALGPAEELAERLARNTQSILIEESNLCRVSDPAAGSGVIEELTSEFATQAWQRFQVIEKAGGLIAAWQSGLIMEMIRTAADTRTQAIGHGKIPITGVSSFPNLGEARPGTAIPVDVPERSETAPIALPAAGDGARFNALMAAVASGRPIGTASDAPQDSPTEFSLTYHRLSEPFEDLRNRAEHAASNDRAPKVILVCLGTPATFTKRATFAQNFFETAGIQAQIVVVPDGSCGLDSQLIREDGALICFCGTNEKYRDQATSMVPALRAEGARRIYYSGEGDTLAELQEISAESRLFDGCDMIGLLEDALDAA